MPKEAPYQYVYQEYPKLLYKPGERYAVVHDAHEQEMALADGWTTVPPVEGAEPVAKGKRK